jgi:hypothetical protein
MNKETEIKRAIAILKEAKNHDIIDKPIPEDDELKIKVADYLVNQAYQAREEGENGDHINAILFTAEVDWNTGEIAEDDPDEQTYREAIQEFIDKTLPVPVDPNEEEPELPFDLTSISDRELRFLHGAYGAYFSRANYLYSIEEAGLSAAKQIADEHEDEYIATADRKDIGGKPKTGALLKIEAAKADPAILKWRERENNHARRAKRLSRMRDIYEKNVERLSREGTLRYEERKHS